MSILLILADDLTGALDTGVQFAQKGVETRVQLAHERGVSEQTPAEVLVINTATRHCPPEEARRVVAACAKRYEDVPYIYKKVDSTLRGNIGAELEALTNALFTNASLPFIPAYPALGRTTLNGQQFIDGVPLQHTETARDALNPVLHSFIPDIIGVTSKLPVTLVPRVGAPKPARPSRKAAAVERGIQVFDCQTNEDIEAIARSLWSKGLLRISAGCAGFAACLADVLPFSHAPITPPSAEAPRPVLVLSGSRHPASVEQVKAALGSGITGIAVPAEELCRPEWFYSEAAALLADRCAAALMRDGACVVGTELAMGREARLAAGAASAGTARLTPRIAGHLGAIVKKVIAEIGLVDLVVFGGDTLLGVMEHLGVASIVPLREIAAGVVLARAEVPRGSVAARDSLTLVTKAGAFGGSIHDLLLKLRPVCGRAGRHGVG